MVLSNNNTEIITEDGLDPEISQALSSLRQLGGKPGRLLARSLRKLSKGRLKMAQISIGIMAAIYDISDVKVKKPLMRYWAQLNEEAGI